MTLLRLYADCLAKIPRDLARSPWVIVLPMGYVIAFLLVAMTVGSLDLIGGFILGFVEAALMASFLYILDELVSRSPVKPTELVSSVRRYLWPVVNVLFLFWIKDLLLGTMLARSPNGAAIDQALFWVLVIALNATPEVIYQRRLYGGLDILQGAIAFLQENWIEWFIPNVAFVALFYYGLPAIRIALELALGPIGGTLVWGLIAGALVLPIFVFRGHLFQELDSGSARQRRFRYGR